MSLQSKAITLWCGAMADMLVEFDVDVDVDVVIPA
jgi:hypothetical protein